MLCPNPVITVELIRHVPDLIYYLLPREREREMEEIAYVEDDAEDTKDHGQESGIVDGEILRRYSRRNVRLGRRWHSRIVRRCACFLLLHIPPLFLSFLVFLRRDL
jgi:hypothetical protein